VTSVHLTNLGWIEALWQGKVEHNGQAGTIRGTKQGRLQVTEGRQAISEAQVCSGNE
jgi:hypothetical protein